MYSKNKIKRKAIVLTTCSILGVNLMVNKDSAQAMKALKAIGHSIKKAVTQEDKKRKQQEEQQQQQLEKKIARLMHIKLKKGFLTAENETKLVDNLKIIKVSDGKVKIFDVDDKKFETVNPLAKLVSSFKYSLHFKEEDKLVSLLEWLNIYIPEAFSIDNITNQLFCAIKIGDDDGNYKDKYKQKATVMCKHLLVHNPNLNQKRECKIKRKTYQFTALEYAQAVGLPEVVEMILNKSGDKQYLLYNAICSGNSEEVKKAISEGANINELVHGTDLENYNPVTLALIKKDIAMADFLIQNGAKPESLDIALVNRSTEMFDYLIQKGFKLSPDASPIELIFKDFGNQEWNFWKDQNNIKFLEKMIQDERINIIWKEDYHKFFSDRVEVYTSKVIRDFYLAHCEEIPDNVLENICGTSSIKESQKIEIAEFIFNRDCKINEYPVWNACANQEYTLAKLLINKGAPIKYNRRQNSSPLAGIIYFLWDGHSVGNDDVNFVKYLVNDCKVSLDGTQFQGLGLIYSFKDYFFEKVRPNVANVILEIAVFLIEKGMNVNAIDMAGNTFLSSCINTRNEKNEDKDSDESEEEFSDLGRALFDLFVKAGAKRYLD